jgi:nucleoside recognition membrane protein YjiH
MTFQPAALRVRLLIGAAAVVVLAAIYLPAVASARAFHSLKAFAHPWHDFAADILLFAVSAVCVVSILPILRHGSLLQRLVGTVCLGAPAWVLGHFVVWFFRLYAT